MKRVIAIVAIVLSVGVVVGAFIIGGGDGSTEAKGVTPTTVKTNNVKAATRAIANAGARVASEAPAKPASSGKGIETSGDKRCSTPSNGGKYEAKKTFVGVSPSTVQVGKKIEIDIRNFKPCDTVIVTFSDGKHSFSAGPFKTDKNGKAEGETNAPANPAGVKSISYVVTAAGTAGGSATSTLTVVVKKS